MQSSRCPSAAVVICQRMSDVFTMVFLQSRPYVLNLRARVVVFWTVDPEACRPRDPRTAAAMSWHDAAHLREPVRRRCGARGAQRRRTRRALFDGDAGRVTPACAPWHELEPHVRAWAAQATTTGVLSCLSKNSRVWVGLTQYIPRIHGCACMRTAIARSHGEGRLMSSLCCTCTVSCH